MKKIAFLIAVFIVISNAIAAQILTQTVKGKVVDKESQMVLTGANIIILGTNPLLGAITDINGNYKIENVSIGRYDIQVSYVGYNPVIIPEILVGSGKEVVINVELNESVTRVEEVVVKASVGKDRPINTMAMVSARSFTVEETRRYAGGLDDPARLVSAFAGVAVGNLQDNAIAIRGNSPKNVSWRLEGVEIPNPNHFPNGNVAGGGFVTIFSSQLLSNSDFLTGAFPAEYGNALAGVFDMKLRCGNNEKRENVFQAGILGIDFASEGPFVKGKSSSYLFNYRYSTSGLLSKMGIIPTDQIPVYQDLSFKLNFPMKKAGTISIWGIGGIDNIREPDELDSTKWKQDWDRIKYDWNTYMAAIGLSHKLLVGNQTYIVTTLVGTGTQNIMGATRLDDSLERMPYWYFVDNSRKITLSSYLNHKFNAKNTLKVGINYHTLFYDLNMNSSLNGIPSTYRNVVDEKGNSSFSELYVQNKYDITSNLSMNMGLHYNYFALNNQSTFEPRFAIKWSINPHHTLSFGYGRHSQLEELRIYLLNRTFNSKKSFPNTNLELSQAQHFVLGYDWSVNDNLNLKIEPYYQYLYDIPGIPDSSFSMINFSQDWSFRDSLANNSKGYNIGVEFTLERFFSNNIYYLTTLSVFNSSYKADDGVWRNTRFDKGFILNVLLGKEFFLKKNKVIGLNGRLNYLGGDRYSPVLIDESISAKYIITDESKAFEKKYSPTYYLDLTLTYRTNKLKHSGIWAVQVKNLLGSPLREGYFYNYRTEKIEESKVVVVLPVLSYKIEF